jgi:cytochrome c biogenesis protein CcmG/thiol:disulfide interchange protein DsbE
LVKEISAGEIERPVDQPAPPGETSAGWKERRWLLLCVLTVALALLALLYYGLRNGPNVETGGVVTLDKPAPDISVTTIDGRQFTLSELQGKVVVLNIWASWCVPCREEAAAFNQIHARYAGADVAFVGIAWNDEESEVRKFVQQYRVPYTVALDPEGRIAIDYGLTGVPETFFIDRQGRLTRKWIGPISASQLGALVEPMVR